MTRRRRFTDRCHDVQPDLPLPPDPSSTLSDGTDPPRSIGRISSRSGSIPIQDAALEASPSHCRQSRKPTPSGSKAQQDAAPSERAAGSEKSRKSPSQDGLVLPQAADSTQVTLRAWQELLPLLRGMREAAGTDDDPEEPPTCPSPHDGPPTGGPRVASADLRRPTRRPTDPLPMGDSDSPERKNVKEGCLP